MGDLLEGVPLGRATEDHLVNTAEEVKLLTAVAAGGGRQPPSFVFSD